jgi:hypothetical protein
VEIPQQGDAHILWKIEATRASPFPSCSGDSGHGSHDPQKTLRESKHLVLLAGTDGTTTIYPFWGRFKRYWQI